VGFSKLAANALACFTPYKGKRLGHADCCDKVRFGVPQRLRQARCHAAPTAWHVAPRGASSGAAMLRKLLTHCATPREHDRMLALVPAALTG
jgi:hypothetical protein